jgi:ribosomal protein S18 acetylase RimI-like enzyme
MTRTYPKIRKAATHDLRGIVTVHQKSFSDFFLTRLGSEFLHQYYGLVLNYCSGIVLVSEDHGVIEGFVCGFVNPAEFYGLMRRKSLRFVLPTLAALFRDPSLAAKVFYGIQRIQKPASQLGAKSCELSSIAVTPEAESSGLGKALLRDFLAESWLMNAQSVMLTTDADGNQAANALYQKAGFQHTRRFLQRQGRWMNEYVMHRVEAGDTCRMHP